MPAVYMSEFPQPVLLLPSPITKATSSSVRLPPAITIKKTTQCGYNMRILNARLFVDGLLTSSMADYYRALICPEGAVALGIPYNTNGLLRVAKNPFKGSTRINLTPTTMPYCSDTVIKVTFKGYKFERMYPALKEVLTSLNIDPNSKTVFYLSWSPNEN